MALLVAHPPQLDAFPSLFDASCPICLCSSTGVCSWSFFLAFFRLGVGLDMLEIQEWLYIDKHYTYCNVTACVLYKRTAKYQKILTPSNIIISEIKKKKHQHLNGIMNYKPCNPFLLDIYFFKKYGIKATLSNGGRFKN